MAGLSHPLAQATRKDPPQRLTGKLALTRRLYQRGWTKPDVLDLYEFIDWLLALPEALEDAFFDEIHKLEESTNMRYISSAERIGMRRGTELGIQQCGVLVLRSILQQRFGDPPPWVEAKLQEGTLPEFEQWAKRSLSADTLEAVFFKE